MNLSKTQEIVFSHRRTQLPPLIPGIERVLFLKILGVVVDDKLTFQSHVADTVKCCNQSFFVLRTLHHQGLSDDSLKLIFVSKILSKLTYASPAWWGFASAASRDQLEAVLRKARKFNYYSSNQANFSEIAQTHDYKLFRSIIEDPHHSLHPLLPPLKQTIYNLRHRGHDYSLPGKDDRNFINRAKFAFI